MPTSLAQRADLVSWTLWPHGNSTLIGHAEIDLDGWIIPRIPIFRRPDGGLSAGTPTVSVPDDNAGRRFIPVFRFRGDGAARWSQMVIEALTNGGIEP
jgi:hypothetical protein